MLENNFEKDCAVHICRLLGRYLNALDQPGNYNEENIAAKAGMKLIIRDLGVYGKKKHLEKDGLWFSLEWHSGWGFYPDHGFKYANGTKYCHIRDLKDKIHDIIASGWSPEGGPQGRKIEDKITINGLTASIQQVIDSVEGRGGSLGSALSGPNCHVHYNGHSICNFSKGPILYRATHESNGWKITDNFRAYDAEGNQSREFSIGKDGYSLNLLDYYEAIFGDGIQLGRFFTEREQFQAGRLRYGRYLVRVYRNKELTTIASYEDFDQANAAAIEEAKRLAEALPERLKQYGYPKPKDIADEGDMLAAWMYYQCRNIKHLVFVQGEE